MDPAIPEISGHAASNREIAVTGDAGFAGSICPDTDGTSFIADSGVGDGEDAGVVVSATRHHTRLG
jgi:hypothetical protein